MYKILLMALMVSTSAMAGEDYDRVEAQIMQRQAYYAQLQANQIAADNLAVQVQRNQELEIQQSHENMQQLNNELMKDSPDSFQYPR